MSHTPSSTAQFPGIRLIGGALAFLLLCGAALLGGAQQPKVATTGLWYSGTQAPLVDVIAYPKDCQRSGEARWRFSAEGDDQPDWPVALDTYPQTALNTDQHQRTALTIRSTPFVDTHHRPQAARAPPIV